MNTQAQETSVRSQIVVDAPLEHAFRVFTEGMGSWKPAGHTRLTVDIADVVFESRVGGEVYDRGVDGSECRWGRVLAYEPPNRIVFSWGISPTWQLESDPAKHSEVEVRFIAESSTRTRVELVHSKLERHGEGWESMRNAVSADDGWPLWTRSFAAKVTA